jgi:hypothetical protein
MTLNNAQVTALLEALKEMQEMKLPFRISMMFAKNIKALEAENEFYISQEREFAQKYLEIDEETQQFVETAPGVFKIKEGMIEDCRAAREALDAFTCDVTLKTLKVEDLEKYDITPKQAAALEIILEDDDEPEAEEAPKEE